jgi:hypothetical protein
MIGGLLLGQVDLPLPERAQEMVEIITGSHEWFWFGGRGSHLRVTERQQGEVR